VAAVATNEQSEQLRELNAARARITMDAEQRELKRRQQQAAITEARFRLLQEEGGRA
jgi:hypothetical protein